MGTLEAILSRKLSDAFSPEHMELANESYMHNVPPGSESHFKLVLVSAGFEGLSLLERQRKVNAAISEELKNAVHAFSQHTYTPAEWKAQGSRHLLSSPPCLGGSAGEKEA